MKLILRASLAWLPFSIAIVTVDLFGATVTLYVVGVCLSAAVAGFRVVRNLGSDPTPISTLAIVILNIQAVLFVVAAPSAPSSLLLSYDVATPAYKFVHGLMVPSISYFALKVLIESERDIAAAVRALLCGIAVFAAAYAAYQLSSPSLGRAKFLGRDAVSAGTLFGVAVILAWWTPALRGRGRFAALVSGSIALITTLSRGVIVGTLLAVGAGRMMSGAKMLVGFAAFLLISLAATLGAIENRDFFSPAAWDPRLENSLERVANIDYWKSGIYDRLETFEPSLLRFYDSPLLGLGFGGTQIGSTVHNFHMELLEVFGALGYAAFLYVFLASIYRFARARFPSDWGVGLALAILVIFVNGVLNGILHGVMPYLLFILLGMLDAANAVARKARNIPGRDVARVIGRGTYVGVVPAGRG